MVHLTQTTVINRYMGPESEYEPAAETDQEYEDRIQSAIDQSKLWHQRHMEINAAEFDNISLEYGSDKPYDTIISDNDAHELIVSNKATDTCQKIYIFDHIGDDNHDEHEG